MRIGRFHIHWSNDKPVKIRFHVVNFIDGHLKDDEKNLNELIKNGWRVNNQYVQENAVVYELLLTSKPQEMK